MFEEIERHENCTVIICRDSETGEIDIAWYDNKRPPALIITEQEEEDYSSAICLAGSSLPYA